MNRDGSWGLYGADDAIGARDIILKAHSADLDTILTLKQIDNALIAVAESASTPERRVKEMDVGKDDRREKRGVTAQCH